MTREGSFENIKMDAFISCVSVCLCEKRGGGQTDIVITPTGWPLSSSFRDKRKMVLTARLSLGANVNSTLPLLTRYYVVSLPISKETKIFLRIDNTDRYF